MVRRIVVELTEQEVEFVEEITELRAGGGEVRPGAGVANGTRTAREVELFGVWAEVAFSKHWDMQPEAWAYENRHACGADFTTDSGKTIDVKGTNIPIRYDPCVIVGEDQEVFDLYVLGIVNESARTVVFAGWCKGDDIEAEPLNYTKVPSRIVKAIPISRLRQFRKG